MKKLIVNADDFGFTHDVNKGIVEAHTRGILGAATLMANGPAFGDAVRLAHEHPTIDVGCHLVLIGGASLVTGEALPADVASLLRAMARRRIAIYDELKAQVDKIVAAGIRPLHLDTHKHTHLLPPVLDAVGRVSKDYGIPWVRRPFDLPLSGSGTPWTTRAISRCFGTLRTRFHRTLASYACRTTDHFAGFALTGRFRSSELIALLESLPEGITEFMTHPGRCTPELMAATTRLKQSREEELQALIDPEVRRAADRLGVEVIRYRDLT